MLALALTFLNPLFTSLQQQEALPDETEVVEETVAEVGGWCPQPPLPSSTPRGSQMGAVCLQLGQATCSLPRCTHSTAVNLVSPPILTHSRTLPRLSRDHCSWEL